MLQLRPNCECCGRALAPDSTEARICSFECTFCAACADATLKGWCPNCGGGMVARPRRAAAKIAKYPSSPATVVVSNGSTPAGSQTVRAAGQTTLLSCRRRDHAI